MLSASFWTPLQIAVFTRSRLLVSGLSNQEFECVCAHRDRRAVTTLPPSRRRLWWEQARLSEQARIWEQNLSHEPGSVAAGFFRVSLTCDARVARLSCLWGLPLPCHP